MHCEKPVVLIVDDDEGICRLLSMLLKKGGYTPEWRVTGGSALERLREGGVSLLLLDLYLPDMRGEEFVEKLAGEGLRFPYVVISGVNDVRIVVKLMQMGALDFIAKDSQLMQLVVPVVNRCLRQLEQEIRLTEIESRFLQLTEHIESVFWISEPGMDPFIYVSPAYEKIWGRTVESVQRNPQSWKEGLAGPDIPVLEAAIISLMTGTERVQNEFRVVRPNGEIRWVHSTAFALINPAGRVERLTGFVHDITERKEIGLRILEAADRERRRLGAELHDDLCQRLAAVKLRCGLLERSLAMAGSEFTEMAGKLVSAVSDAAALSRSMAQGLAPVALDAEGLVASLGNLARIATRIFGVPVHFECSAEGLEVNSETANHIYRISQELISNAAKHAAPSRIDTRLFPRGDHLCLQVINDGKPFPREVRQDKSSGMGMHLLRSRTEALGAALEFHPGKDGSSGTCAVCMMPKRLFTYENKQPQAAGA